MKHSNQQWIQYYNQLQVSQRWSVMTDGGFRWANQFKERSIFIARIGVGYQAMEKIRIAAGLASTGQYDAAGLKQLEIRPYQELFTGYKYHKLGVQHRFRVEERYFKKVVNGELADGYNFNFRLRYQLAFSYPLFKLSPSNDDQKVVLNLADELFINAGSEIVYNVLDKNRLAIGPAIQWNKNLNIGVTYVYQYSQLNAPGSFAHDNVTWLTVKHTMDMSKSDKE